MVWYNIGVVFADDSAREDYRQAMIDQGLSAYGYDEDGLHLTSYARDGELTGRGLDIVKGVAKDNFGDEIEALLIVKIDWDMNTDVTEVVGTVYTISDGVCTEHRIVQDAGSDVIDSWSGVSYKGVSVDARRPF